MWKLRWNDGRVNINLMKFNTFEETGAMPNKIIFAHVEAYFDQNVISLYIKMLPIVVTGGFMSTFEPKMALFDDHYFM